MGRLFKVLLLPLSAKRGRAILELPRQKGERINHPACSRIIGRVSVSVLASLLCLLLWPAHSVEIPRDPNYAQKLYDQAKVLVREGRYAEAERPATLALMIRGMIFQKSPDHPDIAASLDLLAEIYTGEGKTEKAREIAILKDKLAKRALEIREQKSQEESEKKRREAQSLFGQAESHRAEGRYADAVPLLQRALAIAEKSDGPRSLVVAGYVESLAKLYAAMGRYAEAEPLFKRALEIQEEKRNEYAPEVAPILNSLADVYRDQRRFAEAEPLYKRAIVILERAYGPNYVGLASLLENLAEFYRAQGRNAEAEPLRERALAIREKERQERDTPFRARELNRWAKTDATEGNFVLAAQLLEEALAIMEKTLGPEHPETVTIRNDLAALYRAEGREQEAKRLIGARVVQDTSWWIDMAIAQRAVRRGDYAEAEKHFSGALKKNYDKPDYQTAITLDALGSVYQTQGRYAEAEPLHKRALAIFENTSGSEAVEVGMSLAHLGKLYVAQGRYAEAEPLFKRALAISEKERPAGPTLIPWADLGRAQTLSDLAGLYVAQGRFIEAEPLYEQALALAENILKRRASAGPIFINMAERGHIQILDSLTVLHQAQGQATALCNAAGGGNRDGLEALLAQGVNVNSQCRFRTPSLAPPARESGTALHAAIYNTQPDIAEVLLAHGADLNAIDENGRTALYAAVINGDSDLVRLMLAHGATVNATTGKSNHSLLHEASMKGDSDVVRLLLDHGAKVNARDQYDRTALHQAAFLGHSAVVEALLAGGADVTAKDTDGNTALHDAVSQGHFLAVEALLAGGADVNVRRNDGKTPLNLASEPKISELLKQHANKK